MSIGGPWDADPHYYAKLESRLRKGQTFHCPDCGFGFPVKDPTGANAISRLHAEVQQLHVDLDLALKPIYCAVCGSCGEDGCCGPNLCIGGNHCAHPAQPGLDQENDGV